MLGLNKQLSTRAVPMSAMGGKLPLDTPQCASMNRAMITLALCVFPALLGWQT
jgi:hypothetical protein